MTNDRIFRGSPSFQTMLDCVCRVLKLDSEDTFARAIAQDMVEADMNLTNYGCETMVLDQVLRDYANHLGI